MVSYPKILAIILTLIVSAVLTNEIHRLNAVHPQPQPQPQPQTEPQPKQQTQPQPLPLPLPRPHIFMMAWPAFQAQQSELQPQQLPLQPPPPTFCHLPGLKILSLQPRVLSESTSVQLPTTQSQPNQCHQRQHPQTHHNTSQQPLSHPPNNHTSCLPGLNGLKRDIKMNLLTLMLLFGNLPTHLLLIFIYSTTSGEEEVESLRTFVLITKCVNLLIRCVHCLLIVSLFKS